MAQNINRNISKSYAAKLLMGRLCEMLGIEIPGNDKEAIISAKKASGLYSPTLLAKLLQNPKSINFKK